MWVPPQMNGSEERRVVLPCTFSHPDQDTYRGQIHVKWIKDHFRAQPFFQCKLMNDTGAVGDECSGYVAVERFSLSGDPRFRDLSLLVSKLWLNDTGVYFCRVELESNSYQNELGTKLSVTGQTLTVFQETTIYKKSSFITSHTWFPSALFYISKCNVLFPRSRPCC